MCCMMVELMVKVSIATGDNNREMTNQRMVFPEPATQIGGYQELNRENMIGAYIFHGSTEANHLTSNP